MQLAVTLCLLVALVSAQNVFVRPLEQERRPSEEFTSSPMAPILIGRAIQPVKKGQLAAMPGEESIPEEELAVADRKKRRRPKKKHRKVKKKGKGGKKGGKGTGKGGKGTGKGGKGSKVKGKGGKKTRKHKEEHHKKKHREEEDESEDDIIEDT